MELRLAPLVTNTEGDSCVVTEEETVRGRRRLLRWVLTSLGAVILAALVGGAGLIASVRPEGQQGAGLRSQGQSARAEVARAEVVEAYNPDNLVRLHVLAASDDPEDQAIKLKVRDQVLQFLAGRWQGVKNREQAIAVLYASSEELAAHLNAFLKEAGKDYGAQLEIGEFPFPDRTYETTHGTLKVPAGTYPALRVRLGAGKGHNWWCVLFPPLCFLDAQVATFTGPEAADVMQELAGTRGIPRLEGAPWLGDNPRVEGASRVTVRFWILDWLKGKGWSPVKSVRAQEQADPTP